MKDSVIIVSGGMDSITLLYDKKDEIALGISFNYESNHNEREIPFAKMHCERLGIKHITIELGFMHQYFKSSLLEGAYPIPIKFRPNADLLKQVKYNTHFEKSQYTSRSYPFSEDALKEKIIEYLNHNRTINRKVLAAEFHIRKQTALNWLKKLEKSGFLIKEGSRNAPVYFLTEE